MYSAEISRVNPAYFIFMLDQSGSMSDPFGGGQNEISKAAACADAVNRTLANIIVQCSKGEIIRDYFYIFLSDMATKYLLAFLEFCLIKVL